MSTPPALAWPVLALTSAGDALLLGGLDYLDAQTRAVCQLAEEELHRVLQGRSQECVRAAGGGCAEDCSDRVSHSSPMRNTGTGLSTPSTLARSRWNDSDNGFSPTFMITGASTRLSRSDSGPSAPGETDSKKLRGAPAVEAGWRYAFLTPDEI